MPESKTYLFSILTPFILGIILTIALYVAYMEAILKSIKEFPEAGFVISILLLRMGILLIMSAYLYRQWFRQETKFFSDIPFLFATFFLLLFFGKAYDLLHDLTFHFIADIAFLFILKLRFIIMVATIAPMYYLSIGMILFFLSLSDRIQALHDKSLSTRLQRFIFLAVVLDEMFIIVLWLNLVTSSVILPGIVIPSFLIIVAVFYFAYRNKRLSQVRPLVLTIAFALYLLSQIMRPLFRGLFGEIPLSILIAEAIDLFIFLLIFGGLIKKQSNI